MDRTLERWSRGHALAILPAACVALSLGHAWPVAFAGATSFAILLKSARGGFTPGSGFGAANLVTSLRLGLVLALGLVASAVPGPLLGAVVLGIFALDGVDGWLARRRGTASEFGAHFDMEVDALMVLMAELVLWQRGFPVWVLASGILRYLYVLALALHPAPGGPLPRSRFGRYAFAALAVGLVVALALPGTPASAALVIGTCLVSASFARAFHWSYRSPQAGSAPPLADIAAGR